MLLRHLPSRRRVTSMSASRSPLPVVTPACRPSTRWADQATQSSTSFLTTRLQTIGILSQLLVHYEANPYEARLSRGTPMYWKFQCLAAHAPDVPHKLRRALKRAVKSDKALKEAQKELFKNPGFRAFVGTTQAIDLINGGVKTNALPEQAYAVVNHRIATDRSVLRSCRVAYSLSGIYLLTGSLSVRSTRRRSTTRRCSRASLMTSTSRTRRLAHKSPARMHLRTEHLRSATHGARRSNPRPLARSTRRSMRCSRGRSRRPTTHTAGCRATTTLSLLQASCPGIPVCVVRLLGFRIAHGRIDTRYYWALTPHIYRYNHYNAGNGTFLDNGVHTINECRLSADTCPVLAPGAHCILSF